MPKFFRKEGLGENRSAKRAEGSKRLHPQSWTATAVLRAAFTMVRASSMAAVLNVGRDHVNAAAELDRLEATHRPFLERQMAHSRQHFTDNSIN